jgi:prepilin-type processing-associated H-X9-DG protein
MSPKRPAFTLFQLLVILAVLALLFALFLPAIAKMRLAAARNQSQNNLKQLALACHNYHDAISYFPAGVDSKGFSAAAHLLPYIEQANVHQQIDFKAPVGDPANKKIAAIVIKTFRDPMDEAPADKDFGGTNYLFSAGCEYDLKDNNGIFFRDSKVKITQILDGTSNTVMIGETMRGDGMTKAVDVHRQHVELKKDDLKALTDDHGVKEWKDDKNIVGDRCKNWMDGHFLQGTFTATRKFNDDKPDVNCGGSGGLSSLRNPGNGSNIAMGDGSVRFVSEKVSLATWKLVAGKDDGQVIPGDF